MLRPRRLKWDETEFAWIAEDPMGGGDYVIRKADGTTRKGQVDLPYTAGIESGKCVCQSHYDAAWLAGGEEVSEWRPIETAPKDCEIIGGQAGDEMSRIVYQVKWDEEEREWRDCDGWAYNLTHWMPLFGLPFPESENSTL